MALLKIPVNRIEYVIKAMESNMEPVVLARGWNYYHRGNVSELELVGGTLLTAKVKEMKDCDVVLNLENVEASTCTCTTGGKWCKHKAAVLFKAYTSHGRPELLFVSMQKATGAKLRAREKAARPAKQAPATAPRATELPNEWHQYFERRFSGYILSYQQSVESFYRAARETLTPFAKTWGEPLAGVFQMHIFLFVLRRIDRFRKENQSSYVTYYNENAARNTSAHCRESLRVAASQTDAAVIRKRWPNHYKQTKEIVRDMLLGVQAEASDQLDTYRLLWQEFFLKSEDSTAEQAWLRSLNQAEFPSRQQDFIVLALSHFLFLDGDDNSAIAALEKLHTRQPADFEGTLAFLSRQKEWVRMMKWLRWLLPALPRARQEEFHRLCVYWTEAARETGAHDEWILAIRALLPRSYPYYTEYLMKHGRYREWVDLQLAGRVPIENLYTSEFKLIRDAEPALMLPLYHQSVERLIAMKNRNSYMEAVRLLKKLRSCYKDLEQVERWNDYVERLIEKYARLRALQEELEKGKLLL